MEEILLRSGMAHEGDATLNAGAGLPHAFADARDDSLSTCAHVFFQLFCLPPLSRSFHCDIPAGRARAPPGLCVGPALLPVSGGAP